MNLLEDRWIPVVRASTARVTIAPWEITDRIDGDDRDPIVSLDAPRPDFNGALAQLLVGLLSTTAAPRDEKEWLGWSRKPPSKEALREILQPLAGMFNLAGDGPRFKQDLAVFEGDEKEIASLLIEAPGGNTLRLNTDHFVKRDQVKRLCPACAATALLCLQLNAPSGGRGHRTSLRGGGPLTSLILPDPQLVPESNTLWHKTWLNVLSRSDLGLNNELKSYEPEDVYPWMAETRTSEPKSGCDTAPEDASPLQVFWGMPRCILLDFETSEQGPCGLCNREGMCLTRYRTRPFGVNYTGAWSHPLTPYRDQGKGPIPLHPQRGGIGYRDWPAVVMGLDDGRKDKVQPAQVVFRARRSRERCGDRALVWTFGYDMDNMKARCWYEYSMPIFYLDEDQAAEVRTEAANLVLAANEVAGNLRSCLRDAWFASKRNAKGDLSFVTQAFWQGTETAFMTALNRLIAAIRQGSDNQQLQLQHGWFKTINDASLALFDSWAGSSDIGDADPGRLARAELRLLKFNRKKTIKTALRLDMKPEAVPA